MNDKPCPKCSGVMVFRLGQFECQDCGRIELPGPTQEELDERALNPFLDKGSGFGAGAGQRGDGINRRKLLTPPGSVSTPTSAPPVFRSNPEGHDEDESNRRYIDSQMLNNEKHTFMAVYFFFTLGMSLAYSIYGGGLGGVATSIVGDVIGAALATVAMGIPLYYEWDAGRKGCIVFLVIMVLASVTTVVMSIFAKMFGSAWYLIPHIFLNSWLWWILMRDSRGEGDITDSSCMWRRF
jgi:hypothetical protein